MKSPVVIKLNGTLITGRVDGIETFSVTMRENDEQGVVAKSYSSELTFYDDGYAILKPILIDSISGPTNEVAVDIYDECCGRLVFSGVIRGNGIDWCEPECWISAQVIENDPAVTCVKSTIIWDNTNGFLSQPQKKIRYCIDVRPDFLFAILFVLYAVLNALVISIVLPIATSLAPIAFIVLGICLIVCAIPGTDCTSTDCFDSAYTNPLELFDQLRDALQDMNNRLLQCQWYHPTALVRDYINNVCSICGLQFQSSILNDPSSPYYNLLLFSAQVRKGYKPTDSNAYLINDNLPVETLDTLMNQHLKPMFNGQYWIIGSTLIFERKDYLQNTGTWIDSEQLMNSDRIIDNQICFSWIDNERPAFAEYEYSLDASDYIGNEALNRYNDIVEWNSPPSDAQSGSLKATQLSSASRFRNDEAGDDNFRLLQSNGLVNAIFSNFFTNSEKLLLLAQHTPFNYKFLIWDSTSGTENAKIKSNYPTTFTGGSIIGTYYNVLGQSFNNQALNPNKLFNYPLWFKEGHTNNLYSLFHYIDNPRLPGTKLYNFNFTFTFECGQFDSIDFSKTVRLKVGNNIKFGEIKELQIDFVKRTIAVSGIV